jgi:hypothetical protein
MYNALWKSNAIFRLYAQSQSCQFSPKHLAKQSDTSLVCIDERVRKQGPDFEAFVTSKVIAIGGDITQDGLGFSPADREFLEAEVQVKQAKVEKTNCKASTLL